MGSRAIPFLVGRVTVLAGGGSRGAIFKWLAVGEMGGLCTDCDSALLLNGSKLKISNLNVSSYT
jgi:hypothetical protein